jgi:hypothetical protein
MLMAKEQKGAAAPFSSERQFHQSRKRTLALAKEQKATAVDFSSPCETSCRERRAGCMMRSVATATATNGSESAAQQLASLKVTFQDRGLSFRYFADAKCTDLCWQAGRNVVEAIILPDGSITSVERFELLAWARTREHLIEQLA